MKSRLSAFAALAVWAGLWELAGRLIGSDLLPPISAVVAEAWTLVQLPGFRRALGVTAEAFAIGMALAIVVGIPVGILMGRVQAADRLLNVWVNVFISAPLTAVVPALMPLLGIGQTTVVATVFLFAVWVIVIDTQAGVQRANRSLIEMAAVFGANQRQTVLKILVPAAMPEILTGLRLGVVRGVKGVVIGQIVIALVGFGELFELYLQTFAMERFWALVLIIFAMSFLLVETIAAIERRFEFYAKAR